VPQANRLGEENKGFSYLIHNLPQERLIIAMRAAAGMEFMLEQTVAWTKDRKLFDSTVFDMQHNRFKLAEARAQAVMYRVFADHCLALHLRGELSVEMAATAKLMGSELQCKLLDDFLQMHGGMGYMTETMVARAWADARVGRIFGGSSEVMKEIIARTL
jgi:acyl-CoA dehydrogenase